MKANGICSASCGEFVQGFIGEDEYLCSYAIDKYSKVILEEKRENINKGPFKSRRALEKVFKKFDIPIKDSKNISLAISSDIPIGKGMASSTADIGATIGATLSLIGETMTDEEVIKLATEIEPSDSVLLKNKSIINPINGEIFKSMGSLKHARVIVLEPNQSISTRRFRKNPKYEELKYKNKEIIEEAFKLLEKGIVTNDLSLVGQACTLSSMANENIHKKKHLDQIVKIANTYGAYGVNIAHSGTVIGILIDDTMNYKKILSQIKTNRINDFYRNIYVCNIIDGGVR